VWILSRIEYCHVLVDNFSTLDIFFVLIFDRYISRNLAESANKLCGQKLALLAPCSHCRFRELKFSIRKYVIVVLANGRRTMQRMTAEEVEETDIPGISVACNSYSHGCSRGCSHGFLHWQSWFGDKPSSIVRFAVLVVSLCETSNIDSPVSDVSTGRHWICSRDLFLLDVARHHGFLLSWRNWRSHRSFLQFANLYSCFRRIWTYTSHKNYYINIISICVTLYQYVLRIGNS